MACVCKALLHGSTRHRGWHKCVSCSTAQHGYNASLKILPLLRYFFSAAFWTAQPFSTAVITTPRPCCHWLLLLWLRTLLLLLLRVTSELPEACNQPLNITYTITQRCTALMWCALLCEGACCPNRQGASAVAAAAALSQSKGICASLRRAETWRGGLYAYKAFVFKSTSWMLLDGQGSMAICCSSSSSRDRSKVHYFPSSYRADVESKYILLISMVD